ncbi:MAG: hypothetical protein HFJ27_06385 [Clostridia bacterium]|nr:hypothetical protein [Clostridia bacterium]
MEWLGNIVISIAVSNLDEIYSCADLSVISPWTQNSTLDILRESLKIFDTDIPVFYHQGRTIIVKTYGSPTAIGIKIDSCLNPQATEKILEKMLDILQ